MKIVLDEWAEAVASLSLDPDRVALSLNRIADSIDNSDNPSRSRICEQLHFLMCGIGGGNRRVAAYNRRYQDIPTHFITNVANIEEYQKALRVVSTRIRLH